MNDRDPFSGSLEFDPEAWHRAGCPTLESAFVRWQAAEQRTNAAEAELRETAGELATAEDDRDSMTAQLTAEMRAHTETREKLEALEKHATLYDQECGMCGADADDLIAFADWQDEHSRSNRLLDRAVLDALSEIDHSRLREWLQDSVNTIHGVGGDDHDRKVIALCRSELARRGENPSAGVRASDWLKELREEDEGKP